MSDTALSQEFRKTDWALVTGASDGIGQHLATEAAKAGYNVILTGRRRDRLEAHADSLRRSYYIQTQVLTADLSDPDEVEQLWSRAAQGRRIAVLVNNAGLGHAGDFLSPEGWMRESETILVNVIAATILLKRASGHMAEQGGGRILNVASTAAFLPGPGMSVYHASKAYLLSLSEAVAVEGRAKAVFVTALCPGVTATGFFAADGAVKASLANRYLPQSDPARVAADGWRAMEKGRRVYVSGWINKIAAFLPRLSPRQLTAMGTGLLVRRRW